MTPFAQLDERTDLTKAAANPRSFFKGLDTLVRNGLWQTLGSTAKADHTGLRALGNRTSRLFAKQKLDPSTGKAMIDPKTGKAMWGSTNLAKGLTGYGLAGMAAPLAGVNLPGSDLAFNTIMPGMGALFSAPGAITAARASTGKNQQLLREDVTRGARTAAGDLISLAHQDPNFAKQRDLFSQYVRHTSPELADMADNYRQGGIKPMGGWDGMSALFSDPQKLINNRVDMNIQNMLGKSGSVGGAVWGGAKKVFPWLFPTLGVGMVGQSLLSEKPYDETQAQSRGYAGATTKLQDKLNGMTGMQRFLVGLDPSLMTRQIEQQMPGTLAQWEQNNGQKYQPGFLGKMTGGMPGEDPTANVSYYQMDAAGQRKYL